MKEEKLGVKNDLSLRDTLKNAVKTKHPKNVAELAQLVKANVSVNEDDLLTASSIEARTFLI